MLARCKLQLCLLRMYQKRQDFRDQWANVSTPLKGRTLKPPPSTPVALSQA